MRTEIVNTLLEARITAIVRGIAPEKLRRTADALCEGGVRTIEVTFDTQAAARNMVEKGVRGVIINISSNHALGCWPNATVYAAAKAGLDKLGKNMAMELAPHGIRVVTIAPGYTQLPERKRPDTPEANARFKALTDRIPGGRFAEPWEIGDAVVFLASESAGYITGTTLNIDGGSLLPVLAENTFLK